MVYRDFIGRGPGPSHWENCGVGNGLGKCSGHDDVGLEGFVTEDFYNRRKQKAKKGFEGINMVKVW